MQLDISRAALADCDEVAAFAERTFAAAFSADNVPADMQAYVAGAFSSATIASEIAAPDATFLLARADGELLGYAKTRVASGGPTVGGSAPLELQRLYADKQRAVVGVGARLMDAVVAMASNAGNDTLWLAVWEENKRAQKFYRRHRFVAVGTKQFKLGSDLQVDIVMRRKLVG